MAGKPGNPMRVVFLPLFILLCAASLSAADVIEGTVVAVEGKNITIKLASSRQPAKGDKVELVYITSSGMALPVGTWRVATVNGATVTASHVESNAPARKGLKAKIHHQTTASKQTGPTPAKAAPAAKTSPKNDAKTAGKTELTFLGERLVESTSDLFERAQDYYFGRKGHDRDYKKAVGLFRQCAEQKHAHSQNFLGSCYRNGRGVPKDDQKAALWFRKAAGQGLDRGQYNLGVMYAGGHGVDKDLSEALRLFRLSADQGYARAQHNLAIMYKNGMGVPRDAGRAATWMHKAAENDLAPSQYELGVMYENGVGVSKDDQQALVWYRKAASAGDKRAQKILSQKGLQW